MNQGYSLCYSPFLMASKQSFAVMRLHPVTSFIIFMADIWAFGSDASFLISTRSDSGIDDMISYDFFNAFLRPDFNYFFLVCNAWLDKENQKPDLTDQRNERDEIPPPALSCIVQTAHCR